MTLSDSGPINIVRRYVQISFIVLLGVMASLIPVVIGPAAPVNAAPLFYLFALRFFSGNTAKITAFAFMIPVSIMWQHPMWLLIAVGHVYFIEKFWKASTTYTEASLVYTTIIGLLVVAPVFLFYMEGDPSITALTVAGMVISTGLSAATFDVLSASFQFRRSAMHFRPAAPTNVETLVRSYAYFLLLAVFYAVFLTQGYDAGNRFRERIAIFELELGGRKAEAISLPGSIGGVTTVTEPALYLNDARPANLSTVPVFVARTLSTDAREAAMRALNCSRIEDGDAIQSKRAELIFLYWQSDCVSLTIDTAAGERIALFPTGPIVSGLSREVLRDLLIIFVFSVFIFFALRVLRHLMRQSVQRWEDVIARFGEPNLAPGGRLALAEFDRAINLFTDSNNRYVSLLEERDAVRQTMIDLQDSIELSLISQVAFTEDGSTIAFDLLKDGTHPLPITLGIFPSDAPRVIAGLEAGDPYLEFRLADNDSTWYLFVLRGQDGPLRYQSGLFCRLRQPKPAIQQMQHQARLMELGAMSSAISHEIKQPLFTIDLAAKNGIYDLDTIAGEAAETASERFNRIIGQVQRAQEIIARISSYTRLDDAPREAVSIASSLGTSLSFIRPLFVREQVDLRVNVDLADEVMVQVSRVGFEQVIVNGLRNALHAVLERRAHDPAVEPVVTINSAFVGETEFELSIWDNGIGIDPSVRAAAFEPFFSTKAATEGTGLGLFICRQIIADAGGEIELLPAPDGGAILVIRLRRWAAAAGGIDAPVLDEDSPPAAGLIASAGA